MHLPHKLGRKRVQRPLLRGYPGIPLPNNILILKDLCSSPCPRPLSLPTTHRGVVQSLVLRLCKESKVTSTPPNTPQAGLSEGRAGKDQRASQEALSILHTAVEMRGQPSQERRVR